MVVSVSMVGGIDSYFYGWCNDFRGCGKMGSKWRTQSINKCKLQQDRGERMMAPVEDGYPFSFAHNTRADIYGKYMSYN